MSDTTKKTLDDFGILAEPGRMGETLEYDLRAIATYCKRRGVKTTDLSERDIERFRRR